MVALIIEHIVNIKRDKVAPPETIDELEALLNEQQYQEALELCESEKNFVTNMVGAALTHMEHGFDEMRDAATQAAQAEANKLNMKISYISLLANIAPMLGLFGTVFGMVAAFTEIVKLGPAVTPKDLASGVQQALITTVDGLLVAIPCISFGFWIKNKVNQICDELSSVGFDMIERFRSSHATR
jgi:biopolymer transport protein ExbB